MPQDSGAIDAALLDRLAGDVALRALVPDGVWFDLAPQNATRFVLLQLEVHRDRPIMGPAGGRRGQEEHDFLVTAHLLAAAADDAVAAAYRIDQVLEDQPLSAAGFQGVSLYRLARLRDTEADATDSTMRWHLRGGRYHVVVAPLSTP